MPPHPSLYPLQPPQLRQVPWLLPEHPERYWPAEQLLHFSDKHVPELAPLQPTRYSSEPHVWHAAQLPALVLLHPSMY